ncbi:MAG: hypothetical protein ACTSQ8_18920 [Candidatus Helarchaeota archaeon]
MASLQDLLKVRLDWVPVDKTKFMTIKVTRVLVGNDRIMYYYYFEENRSGDLYVPYAKTDMENGQVIEWNPLTNELSMIDVVPTKSKHYMLYFLVSETIFPSTPVANVIGLRKIDDDNNKEEEEILEEDE